MSADWEEAARALKRLVDGSIDLWIAYEADILIQQAELALAIEAEA